MKRFFAIIMVCVAVLGSSTMKTAEAAPPAPPSYLSNTCCDSWGNARCYLNGWYPAGAYCYCFGQGPGTVC